METTWLVVLLQLCVQIFAFPVYLLWYLGLWGPFCKKAFPHFMARMTIDYNKKMGNKKKELFSNLMDFADSKGMLRILEIGTGTGSNFQFYPRGCRITCTDPNPHFNKLLEKSLSENPHLQLERCLVAPGEDLHQIPDASVDVVVSTLVLCSATNTEAVVKEALRVLRPVRSLSTGSSIMNCLENGAVIVEIDATYPAHPGQLLPSTSEKSFVPLPHGGAFYFMEHVAGAPSSWILSWQQILDPTWKIIFDGCHLTRETWKVLEKANFSELKLQHIRAPFKWIPVQPHVVGYGIK